MSDKLTRRILENIGAGGPDRPEAVKEPEPHVDKLTVDRIAPAANMVIKDNDEVAGVSGMPSEPGGIDLERVGTRAQEAGMLPIPEGLELDLYDLYDGAKHELEHTGDFDLAVAIAAHHIGEHPRYYEFLERMEDEMRKEKQSREPGVGSDEADREVSLPTDDEEDDDE